MREVDIRQENVRGTQTCRLEFEKGLRKSLHFCKIRI